MKYMRLGDLLVKAGAISEEQLTEALSIQKQSKSGSRLGGILIDNGIITEQHLIEALQTQLGIEYVDPTAISIPMELAKLIPKAIAKKNGIVPVRLVRDELYLAMSDPLDFVAQEEAKASSHKRIVPMIATGRAVEKATAALYGSEGAVLAMEEMKRDIKDTDKATQNAEAAALADAPDAAPTIRFVNSIIERAVEEHASDIHLEPRDGEMHIRMRIDGVLRKIFLVPANLQSTVISRLKIMCGMNISEHNIPQDGRVMMKIKEHDIDFRASSIPTIFGEKIVIRLLDKTAKKISSETLGLSEENLANYHALLKNSNGVILIVGPTGSGKSTTMCAMLQELASEETNITTLEDPVEYNIAGVNQCQINEKVGMTFASGLRSILRQDPDIISVGEIRDGETGTIAIRAAITGHLVISTLHTNDAVSAIDRLVDIGVEPYLVSSSLKGVVSQRLVRKICPHCKKPYKPSEEELAIVGLDKGFDGVFYRGEGCHECFHTGYRGRAAVFEILMINRELRRKITEGASHDEIYAEAIKNGFLPMREHCRELVLSGEVTAAEVSRAINSTAD